MKYILDIDLVTIRNGTVPGEILPRGFYGFNQNRLRFDGAELVDCTARTGWLLDDIGRLRLPSMHVDSAWPTVNCAWDAKTLLDDGNYRLETAADIIAEIAAKRLTRIKAECKMRIYAIASAETQMNMATATAVVSAKTASSRTSEESTVLDGTKSALAWVDAMRAKVIILAADDSLDHLDDGCWPPVPTEVIALANSF